MARDFKKIRAWELAHKLNLEIYKHSKHFPNEETYGITSQLRRAGVSVPTNIAEGSPRNSNKEYVQFLYIAKGSVAEVEYLLLLSHSLGYLKDDEFAAINDLCQECAKTLYGLIEAVKEN